MSTYLLSLDQIRHIESWAEAAARYGMGPDPTGLLYRHQDRNGVLLYIGVTDVHRNESRQLAHARTARWWPYVDRIDREEFVCRRTAAFIEPHAIRAERPIFNRTVHNGSDQLEREAAYLADVGAPPPVVRVRAPRPQRWYVAPDLGEHLAQETLLRR